MSKLQNRLDWLTGAELEHLMHEVERDSHYLGREADVSQLEDELRSRLPLPSTAHWSEGRPPLRRVG